MKRNRKNIFAAIMLSCSLITSSFTAIAETEETNIFKTDFDSYQIGTEASVQSTFENLSSNYSVISKSTDAAANIAGEKVDDEHGTSMEFNEAWQNVQINLPQICTENDKALVSFDFIAPNVGGANGYLKVLGNGNNNFASQIQLRWDGTAINYWDGVSGDDVKLYKSAIPANKWVKIEYYLDHTEKYYITYVEGKPISKHAMYGEKTPLASLQFQTADDINADHKVYIDNLEVKKVSEAPHMDDITASIESNKVSIKADSVKVNFSGEVDTSTLTTENIKVYDVTNSAYLENVTLENAAANGVDVKFGETLVENGSYRIELANIMGIVGQPLTTTQIAFEGYRGDENNIFKTDFDSYCKGEEGPVQKTFENLSNAYSVIRKDNDAAATIAGVKLDDEHGTSMEFNTAWQNVNVDLPVTCTADDKVLVSLDFKAPNVGGANGFLKILGNGNNNFASQLQLRWDGTAINYWDGVQDAELHESIIPAQEWVKIEYYLNHTEKYYITYVNGKPISKHAMYGNQTPLSSLQFQTADDINADHKVYIDNLEVKKVSEAPHMDDITASIESDKVSVKADSVKVNFSGEVDTATLTTENIKVYDVTNSAYLENVTLENAAANGVDVKFGETLVENGSYRIELANIMGIVGQPLTTTQIAFEGYRGDENNIFKTDFDSYCKGEEGPVQKTFENLSNAYSVIRKDNDAAATIAGVKLDDEHGTSMEFNTAWQNVNVDLPVTCTADDKVLVSLDFKAPNVGGANGFLKILGNGNNNFASQLQLSWDGTAINYWDGVQDAELHESIIPAQEWVKIEYYLNHTEKYYITYVNGKPISKHAMYGNQTPLSSLQFQTADDINADHKVYIDNLEVKKVSEAPHMDDITASIESDKVSVKADSVKVNFSGEVDTATLTTENIKVYDVTNSVYLENVTLENAAADGVDLKFGETLAENGSYRIEFTNITGIVGQNLTTTQIAFEAFKGDENNIFKTDFDSYCVGEGASVQSAFDKLPYAGIIEKSSDVAANVEGVLYDDDYGTSLEFNESWQNIDINLPSACKDDSKVKVSFDFLAAAGVGDDIRVLANDNSSFGCRLVVTDNGINYWNGIEDGQIGKENAMPVNEWAHVEFYIDHAEKKYITYIGETLIGKYDMFNSKTPLSKVQFQTRALNGQMYIDNFEVKLIESMPSADAVMLEIIEDENQENVIVTYKSDDTETTVYVAAYDSAGVLLNVKSEKSSEGSLTLEKKENAVKYKAFLWGANNRPLCGAKEL